ncbi:MAG TPA: hypothetical protein VGU61_16215 [Noviherbaspirillum sp.]|jgi:hypothetical protein|uniref:hypothetical protein n=1 Tax=Noviherbaspirillum sp. TaxID=1926288 RepID=UPI002DDD141D|nr:hypothetical protein [Noviherbaspirillum sp.]HEV2611813.1 hypothetical protein [Noviherbaspirillum sp.]
MRAFVLLLLTASFAAHGAEPEVLGRLFYTPAERAALDKLRKDGPPAPVEPGQQPVEPPGDVQLTVNGIVKASSGRSTTWINEMPQEGKKLSQGVLVAGERGKPAAVTLEVESGKQVRVKPGQTVDRITGVVREGQ